MAVLMHVYCFRLGSQDCYKIGLTQNTPAKRMRGFATGSPSRFTEYRVEATEHPRALEKHIHALLSTKRAENGEFFYATREEVDSAFDRAVVFVREFQPLVAAVEKLREQRPPDTVAEPTDEIKHAYRELRTARRDRLLLDQRIEFLESKIQVAIGQNRMMKGIASWEWVDNWQLDLTAFKDAEPEEYGRLYSQYKRNSGTRRFVLEKVDLTNEL